MYELKVVRERRPGYGPASAVRTSAEVYAAFRARFEAADREEFLALFLDGKNRVQGFHVVSVGSLTAALVHPREVFKPAILGNAAAVVLVHNHPSGDLRPSDEDVAVTRRLVHAAELLGIRVLDHVIVGDGAYASFKEAGLM